MSSPLLEIYFKKFGELSPDPLCPEIRAWNTHNLHELWVKAGEGHSTVPIPFWAIVWPGSRAIARHVLDNASRLSGMRVLDIGTGSGIAAIAAAKAGCAVTGMDVDPVAVEMAGKTAALNRVRCRWVTGNPLLITDDEVSQFDLILAGDLFYEERFASEATRFLRRAAGLDIDNIAADVGRTFRPRTGFRLIRTMRVPVFREIEGIEFRDTNLISLEKEEKNKPQMHAD